MHTLIEQLASQGPILTDGAWGTEFQARGLEAGECPDHWNLTHPDLLRLWQRDQNTFDEQTVIIGICNVCHPFYTGQQKFVDTAGRVDKFQQRLAKTQAAQAAPLRTKKKRV